MRTSGYGPAPIRSPSSLTSKSTTLLPVLQVCEEPGSAAEVCISVRPHISAELCPYLGSLPNLQCSLATSMHAKRVFIWLPIQLFTTFLFLLVDEMLPLKDLEVRPQLSLTDVYYRLPVQFSTNDYRPVRAFWLLTCPQCKTVFC